MPNWCENEIVFKGTKEDIDVLEKLLATRGHGFDFDLFLPYPQQFKELDDAHNEAASRGVPWDKRPKSGYSQGGYEWCIKNWGTNMRPESSSFHRDGDEKLSAWCLTAWSPPLGVIQAISEMFPNLTVTINYAEEGMAFEGFATYQKGVVIQSDEHEMEYEDDEDEEYLFQMSVIRTKEEDLH